MSVYGKALLRAAILFSLVMAAIVLAKPAPVVAAYQDCCQTCASHYAACASGCTTQSCRLSCQIENRFCLEDCPACIE